MEKKPKVTVTAGIAGGKAPAVDDSIESVTDDLIDEKPEANPDAIAQESQRKADHAAQYGDLRDKHGQRFDPLIHVTDSDGVPQTGAGGKLKLKPGRRGGSKITASVIGAQGKQKASQQSARGAAVAATGAVFMLGQIVGGEEWQPLVMDHPEYGRYDEKERIEDAFTDYFVAKGVEDFPPGVALSLALAPYVMMRLGMPQTQSRIKAATGAIKRRLKKDAPRSNTRHDSKREKHSSETDGKAISEAENPDASP